MLNSGTSATGLETDIENGGCTLIKARAACKARAWGVLK